MSESTRHSAIPAQRLPVAILGSGNIGTDLLVKVMRSPYLKCNLFIGRRSASAGLSKAQSLGVPVSQDSVDAILKNPECCELVFDATSALDHVHHWQKLQHLGKTVIDMTPARIGKMCVPAINQQECLEEPNINMITCGGQATIPLAVAVSRVHPHIDYIEIVSSISSRSAGPATRINIDEYIETTESAIKKFSGCASAKAILILNPAIPCIDMQTTLFVSVENPDIPAISEAVREMAARVAAYVPGYQVVVPPVMDHGRVVMSIRVTGQGDHLPRYAGNLDIINCAAVATAEAYAMRHHSKRVGSGTKS